MCPTYYQARLSGLGSFQPGISMLWEERWEELEDRRDEIISEGLGEYLFAHYSDWVRYRFPEISTPAQLERKIISLMKMWILMGEEIPPLPAPLYDRIVRPAHNSIGNQLR